MSYELPRRESEYHLLCFSAASGVAFVEYRKTIHRYDIVANEFVRSEESPLLELDQVWVEEKSYRERKKLREFLIEEYLRDKKNTAISVVLRDARVPEALRLDVLRMLNAQ